MVWEAGAIVGCMVWHDWAGIEEIRLVSSLRGAVLWHRQYDGTT